MRRHSHIARKLNNKILSVKGSMTLPTETLILPTHEVAGYPNGTTVQLVSMQTRVCASSPSKEIPVGQCYR